MPVGKSFFDQYSVICVLGSVVGCVVVPLITQSVESLILSAILISITAKTLSSKIASSDPREDRRRPRDKDPLVEKKVKKKKLLATQPQVALDPDEPEDELKDELRQHEEECEQERRLEEKREKKARKREERLKRKEEERKEKEKEQSRKEKDDSKASRKSECRPLSPPSDQPAAVHNKPTQHERHSSTSSTASNGSTHTSSRHKSHSYKQLATPPSDSLLHITPVVQPPPSSSHFKGWQPLPPVQGPLTWQPDIPPRHIERMQRVREGRQPRRKQNQPCVYTPVTSILQQHKESAQELPRQTEPSVAKLVEPFVAQVGLGTQTVLDCNQVDVGKPPAIPQQPAPSYASDIWASTPSGYYTLFSSSGHTLFGNTAILSSSWDRVEDWPNV